MKIFNKLCTLIKEAIDPHNVKYNDKYIGQYIKEKDDHFKYTFNLKLSGHSLDQFDFRRTKTKNIFKHLKFNEAINLYKEKLIQSINSIVDNNHLIDIKYRSEQSFLIYCSKCYLGFIVLKNIKYIKLSLLVRGTIHTSM